MIRVQQWEIFRDSFQGIPKGRKWATRSESMAGVQNYCIKAIVLAGLCAFLAGCPQNAGDVGVELVVSPALLGFSADDEAASFDVTRNLSTTPMAPMVVSASAPWIKVGACQDAAGRGAGRRPG